MKDHIILFEKFATDPREKSVNSIEELAHMLGMQLVDRKQFMILALENNLVTAENTAVATIESVSSSSNVDQYGRTVGTDTGHKKKVTVIFNGQEKIIDIHLAIPDRLRELENQVAVRMAIAKSLSMGYEFFYLTSYPALVWVGGGDIDWSYDGNNRSIVYHWAGHNEDAIYLTGSEYKPLPHRLKSFVPPDNWHSEKWYTDQRELRKKIILQNKKQVKDREARYKQEELDRLRWDEDNNSKSVFENFIDWAINK
jgi:hypothetical protein